MTNKTAFVCGTQELIARRLVRRLKQEGFRPHGVKLSAKDFSEGYCDFVATLRLQGDEPARILLGHALDAGLCETGLFKQASKSRMPDVGIRS